MMYEGRLRELGPSSLEKKRQRGNLSALNIWMKVNNFSTTKGETYTVGDEGKERVISCLF